MIIKVCGLNNGDNINQLMKLDLDFMGIIFYKKCFLSFISLYFSASGRGSLASVIFS